MIHINKIGLKLRSFFIKRNRYLRELKWDDGKIHFIRFYLLFNRAQDNVHSFNVFLHKIYTNGEPNIYHSHPWPYFALILKGGYWECFPGGKKTWQGLGKLICRNSKTYHRLELGNKGKISWSLVFRGRKTGPGYKCDEKGNKL